MRVEQTFIALKATALCGVQVKIGSPGGRVIVSLHRADEMGNDLALQAVSLTAAQVNANGWTNVEWPATKVEAGDEMAIAVTVGDADTVVGIAQIGQKDLNSSTYVRTPAIELRSLNSYTAEGNKKTHAGKFMALQIMRAAFSEATRTHEMGEFVVTDATDLAVMAGIVKPEAGADVTFTLTLPDADGGAKRYTVDNAQRIELGDFYSGRVQLAAKLKRGATLAPSIEPGTTLLVGSMKTNADYVSTAFQMSSGERLRVSYDAHLPSGSGVAVQYQSASSDPEGTWHDVPYLSNSGQSAGFVNVVHESTGVSETNVRIRLVLTGAPTARPAVRNLVAVSL